MKRIATILLTLLVLLATVAVGDAGAGWLNKDKKQAREMKVQRFDRMPTMAFYKGTLNLGAGGQWMLEETPLGFAPECTVTKDGVLGADLRSGDSVILMGNKSGDVILAWQVVVQKTDQASPGMVRKNPSVVWSKSDPTVGEGGPAEY